MLTKEAIMDYAAEYFNMNGYKRDFEDKSSDLIFINEVERVKVVALAAVNNSESACIRGKGFNKQQVKMNLASALYDVARQKTISDNREDKYIFVIPETKVYARIVKEIIQGINELAIKVLVISDVGQVEEFKYAK